MNTIKAIINTIDNTLSVATWIILIFATITVLRTYYVRGFFILVKYFQTKQLFAFIDLLKFCSHQKENGLRIFLEYYVINYRTFKEEKKFNNVIQSFKNEYSSQIESVVKINNTFTLDSEVIRDKIDAYFDFIKEHKNFFNININSPLSFLSLIDIEYGYAVPIAQISSLQKRYNSDWTKILEMYSKTCKKNGKIIEMSSFFTWLMWGPSIYLDSKENSYSLNLYGLGDESTSIPLVLTNSSNSKTIRSNISPNSQTGGLQMGSFIYGRFKLYECVSYFQNFVNMFDENTVPFLENISTDTEINFLLENADTRIARGLNNQQMYSAYVWAMVYTLDPDQSFNRGFDYNNCTVFFEHANIVNVQNKAFLTNTLTNKILEYFERAWQNDIISESNFILPLFFDKETEAVVHNKIKQLASDENYEFNEHINRLIHLDYGKITLETILENLDFSFREDYIEMKYIDLDLNKHSDRELFGAFYCGLYMSEFPDENERESMENIIKQYHRLKNTPGVTFHITLALLGEHIVGGIIGDYYSSCNSGVIEFVVVGKEHRHQRVAKGLISHLVDQFNMDANRIIRKRSIDYYFFEAENPDKVNDLKVKTIRKNRLEFWKKMSAKKVNFDYIQPPLEESKNSVDHLNLCVRSYKPNESQMSVISTETLLGFLEEFFMHAFDISNVNELVEYKKMKYDISEKESIDVVSL